jgi:protoporphyrinogen oxidase
MKKKAIIIGAGPAGLTAALELLRNTDIQPIVLEASDHIGGISRTVNYKGNRIDIGGHRFFSKSDTVMKWWLDIMPIATDMDEPFVITYQNKKATTNRIGIFDPEQHDKVMLVRNRKSRIYYNRTFFDYPLSLSLDTINKLGWLNTACIGISYIKSLLFPIRKEQSLEEFFINRFGKRLYRTFFKSYTEKVWGAPCSTISAEWGAQRIKGLSVLKSVLHYVKSQFSKQGDISQKQTETSLIERFLYPKYGPGQMWETVAGMVSDQCGVIRMKHSVTKLHVQDNRITGVTAMNMITGKEEQIEGDYFISTMPVKELIKAMDTEVSKSVRDVSEGLLYRDFITVGLLVKNLLIDNVDDNWIYVQEPDVKMGRLQIFNNWSPYMVSTGDHKWIGLEYFCSENDDLWKCDSGEMIRLGIKELSQLGIISSDDVLDATVIKMPKAYPAYFGTYDRFSELREYLDGYENLFLIGRNGMHKYNNQDHSMLTAMEAVMNIKHGIIDKSNIWSINTEQEYHEENTGHGAKDKCSNNESYHEKKAS